MACGNRTWRRATGLVAVALALAGCETTETSPRLWIPTMNPKVTESADFVKANRPADTDFITVSTPEPAHRRPAMSPERVKATETALEGVNRRQRGVIADAEAARRRTLARSPKPPKVD